MTTKPSRSGKPTGEKALRIYDLLREAHKSVHQIWREFPELIDAAREGNTWETAVDAVDSTLYLAEGFFVAEQIKIDGSP